jgi:hypothetical protein
LRLTSKGTALEEQRCKEDGWTFLDLFSEQSVFSNQVNQRIDKKHFVKFDVSNIPRPEGLQFTELYVSVFKKHAFSSDERIATTRAIYGGPIVEDSTIDTINPSNLFLVVNPASVQIECKPKFRD